MPHGLVGARREGRAVAILRCIVYTCAAPLSQPLPTLRKAYSLEVRSPLPFNYIASFVVFSFLQILPCIFAFQLKIYTVIERIYYKASVEYALRHFPACALLGPRQCGKTTLALQIKETVPIAHHFDLEDPLVLKLFDNPKLLFEPLQGLVIIDEVQRRPEIFPYLRVLIDQRKDLQWLILGSASRDLLQQSSETLAGRIRYIYMTPFKLGEVNDSVKLWSRGGFPGSYLASLEDVSSAWRKDFITTFLERDLAGMGAMIPPQRMRRLWLMLAHYHGNLINYDELGRSLSMSANSIRTYVDMLESTFMVRNLKPWHENLKKRQVKSPKIYIRDSGILHTLLDVQGQALFHHPKVGASWEGFALEEVLFWEKLNELDCYFWRTSHGAELDLFVIRGDKRIGYEFKYADVPKVTASMKIALQDLGLQEIRVIIPGDHDFLLRENIRVLGLDTLRQMSNG